MEEHESIGKRKNRLAVFEHVVEKTKTSKRRKLNRLHLEDSSPSESELVIDDEPKLKIKKKKKNQYIKLSEEPLKLKCYWHSCASTDLFDSWKTFNTHLLEHPTNTEPLTCLWNGCGDEMETVLLFKQHMSYHAYLSKLKNIGDNIVEREKLPKCTEIYSDQILLEPYGYKCEWEYCSFTFHTIYDFLNHMFVHIKNNPTRAKGKETIVCCWNGCNSNYSTQTKLADHLKTHTKEKVMGCSSCHRLFSNKTKFIDHRKRQISLSSSLHTYHCSQCLKTYPTERLLRDHMRSHVNHYKCNMCDMTCPKPSILAKHIRFKHVKFKPYKCPTCDKGFVEKYNLNLHLKTHEEENPFKCLLCKFECRSKLGLDSHYVKKHRSARLVYECHCCKKKFRRGTYLTKHLTKQHNYHWPSGHSRFRYRKDQDGVHRLQTVRYESLEVTQEMIRSESMPVNNINDSIKYNLKYDKNGYVLSISERGKNDNEEDAEEDNENVFITINDVDEHGNVIKCQTVESTILPADKLPSGDVVPVQNVNRKKETDDEYDSDKDKKIIIGNVKLESVQNSDNMVGTILEYEMFKNNKF